VNSWFSPFPLAEALQAHLASAGFEQWTQPPTELPVRALLIYGPPDGVLAVLRDVEVQAPSSQLLLNGYQCLHQLAPNRTLIADWRLQMMASSAVEGLLDGSPPSLPQLHFPAPKPWVGLLSLAWLESQPRLLDAYLDLELKAELIGGEPDSRYLSRLRDVVAELHPLLEDSWSVAPPVVQQMTDKNAQVEALQSQLASKSEELVALGSNAEATQGELRQLQEQLQDRDLQLETLQLQLASKSEELVTLGSSAEATQGELRQLQEQLQEKVLQLETSQSQLASKSEELVALGSSAEATQGELRQLQEQLQQKGLQLETLQSQLASKSEELVAINYSPDALQLQRSRLIDVQQQRLSVQHEYEATADAIDAIWNNLL
jgi:hypothetical protein